MSIPFMINHIREALKSYTDIDPARLNGESSDPDVQAILHALKEAHEAGGQSGVIRAWSTLAAHYPGFAAQVEAPSLLLSFDQLSQIAPPTYLYHDLVHIPLMSGATHVLFGAPGIGKSFLAASWAARIAQTHDVIYVMGEGASGYMKRYAAWMQENKLPAGRIHFWNGALIPTDANLREQFIEAVLSKNLRPALIVLDTLSSTLDGDENQSETIVKYLAGCAVLKSKFGSAILAVHHSRKDGTDMRGSSAIRGNFDVILELEDVDGFVRVSPVKIKDDAPFQPWHFILKPVTVNGQTTQVVNLVADTNSWRGITPRQRKVLDILAMSIFSGGDAPGASRSDLKDMTGFSPYDLAVTLSRMLDAGLIDRGGKGHFYPTQRGWNIIQGKDAGTAGPKFNVEF